MRELHFEFRRTLPELKNDFRGPFFLFCRTEVRRGLHVHSVQLSIHDSEHHLRYEVDPIRSERKRSDQQRFD